MRPENYPTFLAMFECFNEDLQIQSTNLSLLYKGKSIKEKRGKVKMYIRK